MMGFLNFLFGNSNSETPDIVYELEPDLKIVRKQNGLEDLFPQYHLYRKIDGQWYKRAWVFATIHHRIEEAKNFLLYQEKNTFEPKQFEQ